jgi:hypothetical protein
MNSNPSTPQAAHPVEMRLLTCWLTAEALAVLLEALTDRKARRRLVGRLRPHVVGWSYPRRRMVQRPRDGVLIGWHHCRHPLPAVTGKAGDPLPGSLPCQ